MNTPEIPRAQVRQPNRAKACSNGVASWTEPLMDDFICCRIDLRDRYFEYRRPDVTLAKPYLSPRSGNADLNIRNKLFRSYVDTGNGAVALVQRPDRACTCGKETRLRTDV